MEVNGRSYGIPFRSVKRGPQLVHVVKGYPLRLPGADISLRQSSQMALSAGMDAPSPRFLERSILKPLGPLYSASSHLTESILASGGSPSLMASNSSYPRSVSMTTSEPLFHTLPEAPVFIAER